MKYSETGFRAIYQHFCAFPVTETVKKVIADYPGAEEANCVLVYGYIDHEAGLSLEVLAAGKKTQRGYRFFETNLEIRATIRIGAVENEEFAFFADEDDSLKKRYAKRMEILKGFEPSEELEQTRNMAFLDECRNSLYPDDVLVVLLKDGCRPEGCWTRIFGLGDHYIMGTLLNEPDQNFGYHEGERIAFFVNKDGEGKITCYTDMNPSQELTADDLADGNMLKEAVSVFNNERTNEHLISIMEIMRDSLVWIPCNAVLSDADQKRMEELLAKADGDLSALVGSTITNQDPVRMIPDILQNGDNFFFPVFSSADEMGDYGNGFSKVQKHMNEAIHMALANEKNVTGIVLNAFSEPFVLDKGLFDLVENMKSRITQN